MVLVAGTVRTFDFLNNGFGCRQTSDYICPSRFWVETTEEKGRLLTDYKVILPLKGLGLFITKVFQWFVKTFSQVLVN